MEGLCLLAGLSEGTQSPRNTVVLRRRCLQWSPGSSSIPRATNEAKELQGTQHPEAPAPTAPQASLRAPHPSRKEQSLKQPRNNTLQKTKASPEGM